MYRSSEGKATQNHFNSDKFEVVYLDFTYFLVKIGTLGWKKLQFVQFWRALKLFCNNNDIKIWAQSFMFIGACDGGIG